MGTVTTDLNGNYIFTDVENGEYLVKPEKTGYSFTPERHWATINDNTVSEVDFTTTAD